MATTTNYGWTTPDDTALVKDGAAAIRSLGTSIDTTVFNNASAGIAKTIVDAKGDLIAATAADTVARLAVGSNDQVLIADSTTATGLKWGTPLSGGMTSIASGSLTGSSVVLSSISGSYKSLRLQMFGVSTDAVASIYLRANADTGNNYTYTNIIQIAFAGESGGTAYFNLSGTALSSGSTNNNFNIDLFNYKDTTSMKSISFANSITANTTYTSGIQTFGSGTYRSTTAITSLTMFPSSGNFDAGTYILYGVN